MIKAIVFDLGNVVFYRKRIRNFEELCKKYDKDFDEAIQVYKKGWMKARSSKISSEEYLKMISDFVGCSVEEAKEIFVKGLDVNQKVKNLMLKLKDNYSIGVLTNTMKIQFEEMKKIWNFEEATDSVVASFRERVVKPDVEAINLIIEKLNVKKDEVIYVDDILDTVQKYNEYGIKSIHFKDYDQLVSELKELGVKI